MSAVNMVPLARLAKVFMFPLLSWTRRNPSETQWAELPGADSTDVLRLDWREFLELFAEGVGQALIERVAHHDLGASGGGVEAGRQVYWNAQQPPFRVAPKPGE